ncbi:hypothetical protein V5P93_005080 [Actinokineospora auranticolor]|uniref:Dehydratase n=1 Tax=Actinokineospora auranticolor TaxID=155976 RepID=A0A2S6GK98_9PSEU|nr:hypothetical protein [Actinokineospora auranticolor]PPK65610.1 hypothetical protein CLV40_11394 [Actinokineospora auranticolor]
MTPHTTRALGATVLAAALLLGTTTPATATPRPVKASVRLKCAPGTWRVEYTASTRGHAPATTITTRVDIGVVDEYGPDKVTGEPPYGLGAAATTGDIPHTVDARGKWTTHEVLGTGPRPSGFPRARKQTTTVTLHVDGGTGLTTATDTCTLRVR